MENAIVKINSAEFEMTELEASEIVKVFEPMLDKAKELELRYNEVIKLEKTDVNIPVFKALRKEYQETRIAVEKIHEKAKKHWLQGGRLCDAWKNTYLGTAGTKEKALKEAEDFKAIQEAKAKEELRARRSDKVNAIQPNTIIGTDLAGMTAEVYEAFKAGLIQQVKLKAEAELKVEEAMKSAREYEKKIAEDMRLENAKMAQEIAEANRIKKLQADRLGRIQKYLSYGHRIDINLLAAYGEDDFEAMISIRRERYEETEKKTRELEEERRQREAEIAKAREEERVLKLNSDEFKWVAYLKALNKIEKPALKNEQLKHALSLLESIMKKFLIKAEMEEIKNNSEVK